MGPAQGMKPSSYGAEGYGMVSILRFLVRISEFCGSKPRWMNVYSDNLALINRIHGTQTKPSLPTGTYCRQLPIRYRSSLDDRSLAMSKVTKTITFLMLTYLSKHS